MERDAPGGQAGQSAAIESYLGFPNGLSGSDLAHRALAQVSRFGAEMSLLATMSQYLVERIAAAPNIEVRYRTEVVAVRGNGHLAAVTSRKGCSS